MRVLKYVFPPGSTSLKLELPIESEVLHVGPQNGLIVVWVLVADNTEVEEREVFFVGTGERILYPHDRVLFVNSSPNSTIVFHAFEVV